MASHGTVNLIEKYARPGDIIDPAAAGGWAETERYYAAVQKQLSGHDGTWDPGSNPLWFSVRAHINARFHEDETRLAFEGRLRAALLADGWNAVTFEHEPRGFGALWVELHALKQPLVVETDDGKLFPATFQTVNAAGDAQPGTVPLEHPTAAAERIVREGCWRYTGEYRERVPPHRIAAVRHHRRT